MAVHPGMVRTGMADGWLVGSDVFHGFLQPVTSSLLRSLEPAILVPAERAVSTVLYATLAPSFEVCNPHNLLGAGSHQQKVRIADLCFQCNVHSL